MTLAGVYAWLFVAAVHKSGVNFGDVWGIGFGDTQPKLNADFLILTVAILVVFLFLACLPALMVLGYKEVHQGRLEARLTQDLKRCGLSEPKLKEGLAEFRSKNSWDAFMLPVGIMTAFVFMMLGSILLSHGLYGIVVALTAECMIPGSEIGKCHLAMVNVPQFLFNLPRTAAPISWAFLGAYFYTLTVLLRRWQRSDLTASTLWKLTVRFAIAFVLGMLLTKIAPATKGLVIVPPLAIEGTTESLALGSLRQEYATIYCMIAFMIGIVPDEFLNWVRRKTSAVLDTKQSTKQNGFQSNKFQGLFEPSSLQRSIDGLNFWQADRLFDEGIESVQDLAMTDIPDMLIKIRYDTPIFCTG